jgi:hypothetical protein
MPLVPSIPMMWAMEREEDDRQQSTSNIKAETETLPSLDPVDEANTGEEVPAQKIKNFQFQNPKSPNGTSDDDGQRPPTPWSIPWILMDQLIPSSIGKNVEENVAKNDTQKGKNIFDKNLKKFYF